MTAWIQTHAYKPDHQRNDSHFQSRWGCWHCFGIGAEIAFLETFTKLTFLAGKPKEHVVLKCLTYPSFAYFKRANSLWLFRYAAPPTDFQPTGRFRFGTENVAAAGRLTPPSFAL